MFLLEPLSQSVAPARPGLALPTDGHDHTDYDGCGHDDPEKVLDDYRASICSCDATLFLRFPGGVDFLFTLVG